MLLNISKKSLLKKFLPFKGTLRDKQCLLKRSSATLGRI